MKNPGSLNFLYILCFILIFSCSTEEDTTVQAPNIVQTPDPEPVAETPTITQHTLTISAGEGGTVSIDGGTYDEGTEVSIIATANEGYRFTGWEGNDSTSESLTITINSDQTLQALFELIIYPFPNNKNSPYEDDYFDEFLVGLNITESEREDFILNANRFIEICIGQNFFKENENGQLIGLKNPLLEVFQTNTWPIYFHFEEYEGEITSQAINKIKNDYQSLLNDWLEGLRLYDPEFPSEPAIVKIFGFVFNENIQIAQSFYDDFGNYPIVSNYTLTNEESPWKIVHRNSEQDFDYNWYVIEDFSSLKVQGNREDLSENIQFYPNDWENFEHPEGIDYFQTKFWYKIPWDAVAQRQYLKMGGNILNHSTGETSLNIFLHEMGHCFFLDDIYDRGKYPDAEGIPSIMNTTNMISNFDIMTLRIVWKHQKNY